MTLAIKAGDSLIPLEQVIRIDISRIEELVVVVHTEDSSFEALGFDAVETVMMLKPSALEGRRLKWKQSAWAFHNLIAHPVVQIMAWLGYKKEAVRFHDWTTPRPRS